MEIFLEANCEKFLASYHNMKQSCYYSIIQGIIMKYQAQKFYHVENVEG